MTLSLYRIFPIFYFGHDYAKNSTFHQSMLFQLSFDQMTKDISWLNILSSYGF